MSMWHSVTPVTKIAKVLLLESTEQYQDTIQYIIVSQSGTHFAWIQHHQSNM